MHRKDKAGREVEIVFFEDILKRMPADIDTLRHLAEAYTAAGRIEDGLRVDLRLKELCPADGTVHYNLACSFSLTGRVEEAVVSLCEAITHGYDDFKWMDTDPDLANVRGDPRYQGRIVPLFKKNSAA